MADKIKPEDIAPARVGVKVKPRKPPKNQEKPRVITNAAPDRPAEDLPAPSEEAIKIEAQALAANQDLIMCMKEFNQLLGQSVLSENKSTKEKEDEHIITASLASAAQAVDRFEPGKGSLALSTFAVRQSLLLRDAGNKLAYEIDLLKQEIKELKQVKQIPDPEEKPSDATKKYILERAKELGVKVSIEG